MASEPLQQTPEQEELEHAHEALTQLLGGSLPGAGLFYPDGAPQAQPLIHTDPERVRGWLLAAVESAAMQAVMPYGEVSPEQASTAALRFAQAYLLLDPTVDEQGVPLAAKAGQAIAEAHGKEASQAHFGPPHVPLPPAAQAIAKKNEGKSKVLRAAHAQRPTPQPRPGA